MSLRVEYIPETENARRNCIAMLEARGDRYYVAETAQGTCIVWFEDASYSRASAGGFRGVATSTPDPTFVDHRDGPRVTYTDGVEQHTFDRQRDRQQINDFQVTLESGGLSQTDPWKRPEPGTYSMLSGSFSVRFRWHQADA